jgi:hypothetical protein
MHWALDVALQTGRQYSLSVDLSSACSTTTSVGTCTIAYPPPFAH